MRSPVNSSIDRLKSPAGIQPFPSQLPTTLIVNFKKILEENNNLAFCHTPFTKWVWEQNGTENSNLPAHRPPCWIRTNYSAGFTKRCQLWPGWRMTHLRQGQRSNDRRISGRFGVGGIDSPGSFLRRDILNATTVPRKRNTATCHYICTYRLLLSSIYLSRISYLVCEMPENSDDGKCLCCFGPKIFRLL